MPGKRYKMMRRQKELPKNERYEMSDDLLSRIYNSLDPFEPATDRQYRDCSSVRGGDAFVRNFTKHLSLADDHICSLFTGHIGSGKSSELLRLYRQLQGGPVGGKLFFPVLIDANNYLDEFDVDVSDIFLAIATELSDELEKNLGISIKESYFAKRLRELKGFLSSEVDLKEGEFSLIGAKVKIQGMRREPEIRQRVRDALGGHLTSLVEAMNEVLEDCSRKLKSKKRGFAGLVLIVDNLEKIQVVEGKQEGVSSQRQLFVERAPQLTGLRAHIIYTVPLRLAREFGPELGMRYDQDPFVLPMIKITDKTGKTASKAGIHCLKEILAKRIGGHTLEEVFNEKDLDFVIKYSGGSPRHLMTFAQNACSYLEDLPVTLEAVQRAIGQSVRAFSVSIAQSHWEKLAMLERSKSRNIENQDKDYLELLEKQCILEYLDIKGGQDFSFESQEPWYSVHPVVRELGRFKAAVAKLGKRQLD